MGSMCSRTGIVATGALADRMVLKKTFNNNNIVYCWPGDNGGQGRLYQNFATGSATLSSVISNSTCSIASVAGTDSVQVIGSVNGVQDAQYTGTYRVEVCGNRQHHVSQANRFYDALGSGTVRDVQAPNDSTIYSVASGTMYFQLL